jgi:ABC-type transport system involved in multi-copper enzyme maturation permease subunit
MFGRMLAITLNTYREAVRARILYGMLAAALGTTAFLLVIATLSLRQEERVIADLGSASISLYAVLVAILLGATSLHREVELKTIFPILTRELRRYEYLLGKYLGTIATMFVFIAIDGAVVLGLLGATAGESVTKIAVAGGSLVVVLVVLLLVAKRNRVYVTLPWALIAYVVMAIMCGPAKGERQLVLAQNVLSLAEVGVVAAVATLFSSFSSPFLTGIFTLGVFILGRSTDTLANLPARVVGAPMKTAGSFLAHVLPNLHLYVPPRPLLLGQVSAEPTWTFVLTAIGNAALYAVLLLTASILIFKRRDFQ